MARPLAPQTSLQTAQTALTPAQTAAAGTAGAKHGAEPELASRAVQGLTAGRDSVEDSRPAVGASATVDADAVLDKRGALHDGRSVSMALESTATVSQKSESGMQSALSEAQSSCERGSAGAAGDQASKGALAGQPLQGCSPLHSPCTSLRAQDSSGVGQASHGSSTRSLEPGHGLSASSMPGESTSSVCTGHAEHGQHDEAGPVHLQSTQTARGTGGTGCESSKAAVESVAKVSDKRAAHGAQEVRQWDCTLDQMIAVSMIAGLSGMLACGLVLLASSPALDWWG